MGFLHHQKFNKNIIVDKNGAVFFGEITRNPRKINDICQSLLLKYNEVTLKRITTDFNNFISKFQKAHIVEIMTTPTEASNEEYNFCPAELESKTETIPSLPGITDDVNKTLDKYFGDRPQLMSLQIEVTSDCNLRCVHCYLECESKSKTFDKVVSTETLLHIIAEFRKLGGLHITFTGGEAMLNKDLSKLLIKARENDLSIQILTNSVLLDDELLTAIKETNTAKVQVSLYSMVPEVHDAITKVKGSFTKTKKGIETLLKNGISVQIACVVLKENLTTFDKVLNFGDEEGLTVKAGCQIMAQENFGRENLQHRIAIDDVEPFLKKYIASNKKFQQDLKSYSPKRAKENDSVCGVGKYGLILNAEGKYLPCTGFNLALGDVYKNSLEEVFYNSPEIKKLRDIKMKNYPKCLTCEAKGFCNICPVNFYNESGGDIFALNNFFCEVAHKTKKLAEQAIK